MTTVTLKVEPPQPPSHPLRMANPHIPYIIVRFTGGVSDDLCKLGDMVVMIPGGFIFFPSLAWGSLGAYRDSIEVRPLRPGERADITMQG